MPQYRIPELGLSTRGDFLLEKEGTSALYEVLLEE
jgi:hypothetical protein